MASRETVKNYCAQWLQLGKKIIFSGHDRAVGLKNVVQGEGYSPEFESFWYAISGKYAREAYLEDTDETIHDLLSERWELLPCPRCRLLSACISLGVRQAQDCPCHGLDNHPNLDMVMPHVPVRTQKHLGAIRDRLVNKEEQEFYAAIEDLENPVCLERCHTLEDQVRKTG